MCLLTTKANINLIFFSKFSVNSKGLSIAIQICGTIYFYFKIAFVAYYFIVIFALYLQTPVIIFEYVEFKFV